MMKHLRIGHLVALLVVLAACSGQGSQTAPPSPAASAAPSVAQSSAAASAAVPAQAVTPTPIGDAPPASPFPLQAGWWDNAVCYEVFVRSFYDSDGDGIGDINGLIAKLDYINDGDPGSQNDLGANCIWLMPVTEATSYHGYDVVDYYNVEQDYGTNDDFKRLIDEAHGRGIRVIIDLVLNHTSSENPWFKDAAGNPNSPYRDWYIWSPTDPGYRGPWGDVAWHPSPSGNEFYYGVFWSGMPDLNYRNPAVTEQAKKISAFWLNEMGADGFRLDAIKHLIENGATQENTPETVAWLRGYREFVAQTKPDAFTIGEVSGATPVTLKPYYPDQLDSYFVFDVGQKTLIAATTGQARQFTGSANVANNSLPFGRWAPFLTNHDQDRAMSVLGDDVAKAKVAATALLTLPGLPFVYYGEEIGMLGAKGAPPRVDEPLRTPMQWSAEANGGFTSGQPWQPLQPNVAATSVAAQDSDPDSLLNLYRRLIRLHTSQPALAQGSFTTLDSSERAVGAFVRQYEDEAVLVVINFGREDVADAVLSAEASDLAAGSYALEPLLGDEPGAALAVNDGGSIADYTPLPTLAAQTGYIFKLVVR